MPFLEPYWDFLLVHPLISLLVAAYDLVGDFGFAIVAVPLAIRLALYPPFKIQIRNQRAMQELAPALLASASQLMSSVMLQPMAQPKTVDPQQKMMQSMQYYFPLSTVFIAWNLPAGLGLYWVTTTLFGIVQQYFVSGWGQLPRFLPFLKNIPSPADRTLAARQQAALDEERRDMGTKLALANGPTNATDPERTREARRQRNRNKKR